MASARHKQDLRSGGSLAEYPVKVEDGVVYIDTEGVSPLFASP